MNVCVGFLTGNYQKANEGVLLPRSKLKEIQSERQREIESVEEEVCAVQDYI